MIERTYWHSDAVDKGYPIKDWNEHRTLVSTGAPEGNANLASSLCGDGLHAPALDLDLPCELIPSSTPGHYHLLIDHPMKWWRYRILLRALVFVGLIEPKYYRHSVHRGMTMLRLPYIHKGVSYEPEYLPVERQAAIDAIDDIAEAKAAGLWAALKRRNPER